MAVTPEWCNITHVKGKILSQTDHSDAEINQMILESEAYFKALLRYPSFTFDDTKDLHIALRGAVACRTALLLMPGSAQCFSTLQASDRAIDVLSHELDGWLEFIQKDSKPADAIKEA